MVARLLEQEASENVRIKILLANLENQIEAYEREQRFLKKLSLIEIDRIAEERRATAKRKLWEELAAEKE